MPLAASCPNCNYDLSNLANVPPEITRTVRLDVLLASNTIPSAADISNLANIHSGASQVAADLEKSIKEVESLLNLLEEAHMEMVRLAEECTAVIHPVRRLPQELLCEIFFEASVIKQDVWEASARSDAMGMPSAVSSLDRSAPPWTLTQVARRWRTIALSDPSIWSSIAVSTFAETSLPALTLQLQRSANHRLDIYLTSNLQHDDFLAHGNHLLSLLLASSTRWERLYYAVSFTDILSPLQGFLPALRILYLRTSWDAESIGTQSLIHLPVFRDSPSLRTVVCGPNTILHFQMPLNQIEEWDALGQYYNQSTTSPSSALEALKRLRALKSCRLHVRDDMSSSDTTQPDPLHLTDLQRFHLTGSDGADFVISQTTCSKLKELRIAGEVDVNGLLAFIQRSQISLETFELVSFESADEGQVLSLLQQMPRLQNLTLQTPSCYEVSFFLALSVPGPIPALRTLTLRGPVECPQALVSLRESRPGLMIELEM
ncbi:hypothetical protein C8J56DRAFT_520187 [Mycena floridula]|nr:hypothetical protein C8J56DRAFT_520187 [Mycena floridula]